MIHFVSELPYELEHCTCTCRRRVGWSNNWIYSDVWNRPVHSQCGKPEQDQVIYQCAWCDDLFVSKTLYPCTQRPESYAVSSVIYIARSNGYFPIKDVFCSDGCEASFN